MENVRRYSKTEKLEDAIESAVNALPDDSEIKGLLAENLSEVKTMCITEYTQENADMLREIETQKRINHKISLPQIWMKKSVSAVYPVCQISSAV